MAENSEAAPQQTEPQGAGDAPPARPDYIPEKFWQADKGAPNVEALGKSYIEAEKRIGKAGAEAVAKRDAELFGKRPEKPDAYEVRPPATPPEGVVILAEPPGADFVAEEGKAYFVLNPADPLLGMARTLAHRAGMSQDEFDGLVGEYAATQVARQPTADQVEAQRDAVYKSLGENGRARVAHAWGQLQAKLGDKAAVLDGIITTKEGVEVLEEVVAKMGGAGFSPANAGPAAGAMSEADLRKAPADPRYGKDAGFMAAVEAGWKRLYPGGLRDGRVA